jgi:hypothetical protein
MEGQRSHEDLIRDLTRRGFLQRAGALGLGAVVASALPVAERLLSDDAAARVPLIGDVTLQAFADTIIPGRRATRTDLGHSIDPRAIAGVARSPGSTTAPARSRPTHSPSTATR